MSSNKKSEIVVLKHHYTYTTCLSCKGTGVKKKAFRQMTFVKDCPCCKGERYKRSVISEEISLIDALRELNIPGTNDHINKNESPYPYKTWVEHSSFKNWFGNHLLKETR